MASSSEPTGSSVAVAGQSSSVPIATSSSTTTTTSESPQQQGTSTSHSHLSLAQQLAEVTNMAIAVADAASAAVAVATSSSESPSQQQQEDSEPLKKKSRTNTLVQTDEETTHLDEPPSEKLEARLGGILSCAVCLDLPKSVIYQCPNGHLMCSACFTHLLADCRLRDESATCPNCRIEISKHAVQRNLAVEKAVSELPDECQYCGKSYPRHSLEKHEGEGCVERTKTCRFSRIGCPWRGPWHELRSHESSCFHPNKSGSEVMEVLAVEDAKNEIELKLSNTIFDLLSIEKITFNDLQLKPYRTDEFVHKLYYETSRFTAFNHQFVVKARISSQQRDPTHSCERVVEYQLILKTKPSPPQANLDLSFVVLKGPFGDMKLRPRIHKFEFSEVNLESSHFILPLVDSGECNRVLAAKTIHFRLIVFLQS